MSFINANYAHGNIQTETMIIQKYTQNGKDETIWPYVSVI